MIETMRPVLIYFIAEGDDSPAFDIEIAEDDNRYTYDGWLPLALEKTADGPRVRAVGDNWLSAPGEGRAACPDAGPVSPPLTAADCRAELLARLQAGIRDYSGEWPTTGYDAGACRRYMAANVAETLRPLLAKLDEEHEVIGGLATPKLDHVEISIGSLQFMESNKGLDKAPADEQQVYARAVEHFVRNNLGALRDHARQRAAETRGRIGRLMHAAIRLGAFEARGPAAE